MEKKIRLLILEDEYSLGKNMKTYLESHGMEVFFTTHAEHALDLLKENAPDVMTLDLLMPTMNGYRVLEEIQRVRKDLPVIVITGSDISGKKKYLLSHGVSRIFEKPFDPDCLLESVNELASK